MQKGKSVRNNLGVSSKIPVRRRTPEPEAIQDPVPDAPAFFDAPPSESDYTANPTEGRKQPTPRDIERNRRVGELFNRVIPGLPIDPDLPELRQDPEPFAQLIERTLKHLNIDESPWLDDLNRAWPTLLPPEVTQSARPGKFADGILYIYVTSSVKLFELRRTRLRDIERIVRAFPGGDRVRHVRLMVNAVALPQ